MPLILIIIIGWSSEKPLWASRLGSIPSTLNVFLAAEGEAALELEFDGEGESLEEGVELDDPEKRYLRFFWRKTGYFVKTRQYVGRINIG